MFLCNALPIPENFKQTANDRLTLAGYGKGDQGWRLHCWQRNNRGHMKQKVLTRNGVKTVDLNPRRAIRRHCHMCSDYSWSEVVSCQTLACELHPHRFGNECGVNGEGRTEAIRRYCRNRCSGGDENLYRNCDMCICPLFNYRLIRRLRSAHGE